MLKSGKYTGLTVRQSVSVAPLIRRHQYFVDSVYGNDGYSGTQRSKPWQTLARVAAATAEELVPTALCRLQSNQMWRETLSAPFSGVSGNPITFEAYGSGALPIINAADIVTGWSVDAGNIYEVAYATAAATVVIEDGARLIASVDKVSMVQGSFFLDDGADTLYVWCTDDADPDTHTMEVGMRVRAIDGNEKDYIIARNLHPMYATGTGIYLNNAINWLIQNCAVTSTRGLGIFTQGTCNSLTVRDSDFDDCGREAIYLSDGVHPSGDILIASNNFFGEAGWDQWYGDAIDIKANNTATISITDNVVTYDAAWVPSLDQAEGITVNSAVLAERNVITNHVETAIGVGPGADGSIFRYNKILCNRTGSTIDVNGFTISDDNIQIYNNLLISDNVDTTGEARAFYVRLDREDLEIYNNTVVGNWKYGLRNFNGDFTNCAFKNNTISGFEDYAIQLSAAPTSLDSNYNHLYSAVATNYGRIGAADFATFVDWQGTGYDINSVTAAPQFVGAPADLHLGAGSPCRNAGEDVSLTQDYDGVSIPQEANPAIGAYEYVA